MKLPFLISCRQSARLLSGRLDRRLSPAERVTLRMHLAICKVCPVFDRQLRLMSRAMGTWRAYSERNDLGP
ncbi:zf-HC2 domain-containing protein [Methylibium petroleiphilum]|uniref:zf-HC2 domain-containing protein n=1 Tax=Methylibium petroleiphilum TaxID=105560 RepID=UPI003D2B52BA